MESNNQQSRSVDKFMFWFFAGGETRDDKFNVFTGSFIELMSKILEERFTHIKGIYYKSPMLNVAWALSNAQRPGNLKNKRWMQERAFRQITSNGHTTDTQHIFVSSSSGSVVAAQTACYLAEKNIDRYYFKKPFHLALGASMISKESELYLKLMDHQKEGTIGTIIHDDLQDKGDSSIGIGGKTTREAYINAFGLMFPMFSNKFDCPSFLNTHPVKGHLHRRRSQTVQKALDFIDVILIKNNLAGDLYRDKAMKVIKAEMLRVGSSI